ncbi:hypothetical protein BJD55_gp143 [Gordonia phage Yvonnetastic]|uniref:Uncharacterized protein n=1 Tax=Gordonia phage Yvonnetastic TaxID=1821566 RepID=A0A142K940_9CAUD|nr:hypothetical protein BJD55_gp143 [Gordonia phage Yvonnetastic]AMS02623.1 hypothetical protein SEA_YVONNETASTIC_79 [Gordonia phage Yvonnetastic]WKW86055.1 hypothetical protein SEA_JONJAMES_81 [Gordonia Phage JonJames]
MAVREKKTITHICDRCGAEVVALWQPGDWRRIHLLEGRADIGKKDICKECGDSLDQWFYQL